MDPLARDLLVGAIGSVLGALFVFIGSQGWRVTKTARDRRKRLRAREEEQWRTRQIGIRQGISNVYLFDILKYLLLGNLLLAVPTMATWLDLTNELGFIVYRLVLSIGGGLAFACFFLGLGKASRYMRLRALDSESTEVAAQQPAEADGASRRR